MNTNHDFITFISKHLYFKKARVAILAEIIKIAAICIKITFKDLKTIKKKKKLRVKMQSTTSVFLDIATFVDFL